MYHHWRNILIVHKECGLETGTTYHNKSDNTDLYDITDINEWIQECSGSMPATKKGKLHMKVCQSNGP